LVWRLNFTYSLFFIHQMSTDPKTQSCVYDTISTEFAFVLSKDAISYCLPYLQVDLQWCKRAEQVPKRGYYG